MINSRKWSAWIKANLRGNCLATSSITLSVKYRRGLWNPGNYIRKPVCIMNIVLLAWLNWKKKVILLKESSILFAGDFIYLRYCCNFIAKICEHITIFDVFSLRQGSAALLYWWEEEDEVQRVLATHSNGHRKFVERLHLTQVAKSWISNFWIFWFICVYSCCYFFLHFCFWYVGRENLWSPLNSPMIYCCLMQCLVCTIKGVLTRVTNITLIKKGTVYALRREAKFVFNQKQEAEVRR